MSAIQEIITEYTRMRKNGLDSKTALSVLRAFIEPLSKSERDHLAGYLRTWEANSSEESVEPVMEKKGSVIQPLGAAKRNDRPIRSLAGEKRALQPLAEEASWINCSHCGKKNRRSEVFCYSCGYILETVRGEFDTRQFVDASDSMVSPEYFGPDSVLHLEVRGTDQYFELRPQQHKHELVIGRNTGNNAMVPDVDLAPFNAANSGVSRLHMAIKYEDDAIHVYDLGSANNSFINGQRLHPKENRILRHGDELRLGRFVMRVSFLHPGQEIR